MEKSLNNEFPSLCEWFIDRKLSFHSGDDEKKLFFFSSMKSPQKLSISYEDYSLKQHHTIEYIRRYFYSNPNGESIDRRVLKKINT